MLINNFRKFINRAVDVLLLLQPVFPIPLYFTVITHSPPFWLSLIISLIPLIIRYQKQKTLFKRTIFDFPILIFVIGSIAGFCMATNKDTATGALISLLASTLVYYGITSNRDQSNKYWISFVVVVIFIS